jgi:hypothetical protein
MAGMTLLKIRLLAALFSCYILWRIKITLAHRLGRAALLRRRLADQQVSPTELAMCQY